MPRPSKRTIVVVILLAISALVPRMVSLGLHSLLIDEAFVGVAARDIAFNHTPMWDAVSNAPYVWGLAQLISLLGDTAEVLRLPSALFGASVSMLIFFALRRWAGEGAAIVSAAIYALHPFAIAFTRLAFVDALQLPMIWIAIVAIDRYFEQRSGKWLATAILSAALAFIFKYNAIAVLGCWMLAGLLLRRYSIKTSLWVGTSLIAASLATLLLWPFDAPLWFFSFLAKGGTYDGKYIWDFYAAASGHVTLGLATLAVALLGYLILLRKELAKDVAKRLDHHILFGFIYFGLLLVLGRPFQRYLLILTIPISILYGELIYQGWVALKGRIQARENQRLRVGLGAVVLIGVLIFGLRTASNYQHYLHSGLMIEQAASEVRDADRVFWAGGAPIVLAYYLGFNQFYSRSTRGALDPRMSHHYFEFSHLPYSADTLPYGVLLARRELKRLGPFQILANLASVSTRVRELDSRYDKMRRERLDSYYYTSDVVKAGDLMIEAHGIDAINGEPYFERFDSGTGWDHRPAHGFTFVAGYSDGRRHADTLYHRFDFHPEIRILRKIE